MGFDAIFKRYFPAVLCLLIGVAAYFQASGMGQLVAASIALDPSATPVAQPAPRSPPPMAAVNQDHTTTAGAIISHLMGDKSPEVEAMQAVFEAARGDLEARMLASLSGQELVERGFADDVRFAAEMDVSGAAPMLMMHRQRYRAAVPASEMAAHRIRYFEDVSKGGS